MKGYMKILSPSGNVVTTQHDKQIPLDDLRARVGGWLEVVPLFTQFRVKNEILRCVVLCNEEGKLEEPPLPYNPYATALWNAELLRKGIVHNPDYLVGDIVVLAGDKEFLKGWLPIWEEDEEEDSDEA